MYFDDLGQLALKRQQASLQAERMMRQPMAPAPVLPEASGSGAGEFERLLMERHPLFSRLNGRWGDAGSR